MVERRPICIALAVVSACGASPSRGGATEPERSERGPADLGAYGGPAVRNHGGAATVSRPDPVEPRWDDFAFAVRAREGSYWAPWIVSKLTTLEVGKTCWNKLARSDSDALVKAHAYTRSVHELARSWTGKDWERLENRRGDRAQDRRIVEPMIDELADRFHVTIAIEGEDCEVHRAPWLHYWQAISDAIERHPPKAGRLFVTLSATSTARDLTIDVDPDGTSFTIVAPRDSEPKGWSTRIEDAFRRHSDK